MSRVHMDRGGSGAWLAALIGLLIVVVAIALYLFYAAPRPGPAAELGVAFPQVPTPTMPAPPTLPSRI